MGTMPIETNLAIHIKILFFLKILFIYFYREEKERIINVWLPLAHPQLARNSGMCPEWE